ncbi:hypothetical protein F4780DRAFT_737752 [Xylariomycetidae sp. FL0641]|nr:hypothetical protein F4780DRAFT_737752 [Xylariomycetidae sp. FL0641]
MPSVTEPETPMYSALGKKRRRDDAAEVQMPFNGTTATPYSSESHDLHRDPNPFFDLPRKVFPLPVSKRFRVAAEEHRQHHHNAHHPSESLLPQPSYLSHAHPEQHPTPPISPHIHPLPSQPVRPGLESRTSSAALLSPCHICHRKPTKRKDLDSFADCMGCGQRTCYVCIRQCQGWLPAPHSSDEKQEGPEEEQGQDLSASFTMHDVDDEYPHAHSARAEENEKNVEEGGGGGKQGDQHKDAWASGRVGHRDVICSRCCVERGSEGDVVCLGCLAGGMMEEDTHAAA